MTKPLLIKGGHIIDPAQSIDGVGSLLISEGIIAWLAKGDITPQVDCDVLDARGLVVCPGFIDLHCHLREPGFEEKETIATGTRAAARGGFTTVCCMPNTRPPLDNVDAISYVKQKAATEGAVRVLPIACISKGRKGEELVDMEALATAGAIGFSDDGDWVADSDVMRQALEHSKTLGLPVISHCEDKVLAGGGVINKGETSAKLGLHGMLPAAEKMAVARDLGLAQITGGRLHIAHVSTESAVELVRKAKSGGTPVSAEVTPHHLTLTEEAPIKQGTNAKVNPPLRTKQDCQALIQGLKDGVIDIIATDHAPHTTTDKDSDFTKAAFGISGLETALGSLMTLVHEGHLSLPALIAKLTSAPARIIGDRHGRLGTLNVGAPADVTIFDPEREWLVDPSQFASKGKNTPLAGAKLKGKVMATIVGGELVYMDEHLSPVPNSLST
ncbi:MAG: dihydroorotase [Chloroflexi bacterium]|nr:dihydroorotase [Chloroflexota bacterium]